MTRGEVATLLRGFVRDFALDLFDACDIFGRVGPDGIDAETLGDWLDGNGYPELAAAAYALEEVAPVA